MSEAPAPKPVPVAIPLAYDKSDPLPTDNVEVPAGVTIPEKLYRFFKAMTLKNASDLHLKVGNVPHVRFESGLQKSRHPVTTEKEMEEILKSLLSDRQYAKFIEEGEFDIAYQIPGGDRYRINVYRQRGLISLAARRVTCKIPNFEQLHLPSTMANICEHAQGLVLIVGPTGSGKSTTIAAILEHINKTRPCHIVTIEDPIEFVYQDKLSLINQREVGIDVVDFHQGIRAMLREDPDVVLVGEMRDQETFSAAIQAAETGHLVFGTLHASSAPQAISRIVDLFPPESRPLLLQSMAYNLKAVVCQRLLPCIKKEIDRVPAVEILLTNAVVREKLEKGKDNELGDVMKSGAVDGMLTFTQSLYDLIIKEMIDPKDAYAVAPSAVELKMLLKGISQDGALRRAR